MPPEMGRSGPLRRGMAGASESDLTAGPPAAGAALEVTAGTDSAGAEPFSSDAATIRGAAVLRAGAPFGACCAAAAAGCAGEGFGCAGVGCAGVGCAFATFMLEGAAALGGGCEAAGWAAAGCDIFASIVSSRK